MPILDKNVAPMGPRSSSNTAAGVWRKASGAFPRPSSVLDKLQSATKKCPERVLGVSKTTSFGHPIFRGTLRQTPPGTLGSRGVQKTPVAVHKSYCMILTRFRPEFCYESKPMTLLLSFSHLCLMEETRTKHPRDMPQRDC